MNRFNKTTVLGFILIIVGLVIALSNTGLIPWQVRRYIFQWENILMLIGIFLYVSREDKKSGAILFSIGLFLVIDDWFDVYMSIWDFWPVALIIVGIYIIKRKPITSADLNSDMADEKDTIEDTAIFSGGDKVINSHNFRGGSLTAIFGGSNIDLTGSTLSPDSASIELFYMFGGSKIRIPQDWNVEIRATSIFGGLTDKRVMKDYNPDKPQTLQIKGLIIFGGAELTN